MCKLCVFAGTGDGRRLVESLRERKANVTACVATEYGEALLGAEDDVRMGRMSAVEMNAFFSEEYFDAVIDATHPYADIVTENISKACAETGTLYYRMERGSSANDGDGVFVESAEACVRYLEGTEGNILLTTGSKDLPIYSEKLADRIYARVLPMQRSLEICSECGIEPSRIIAMQGPFTEEINTAMLNMVHARYMVTKDGGSVGGYEAKIRSAQKSGAIPIIIGRPPQKNGLPMELLLTELENRFGLQPAQLKRKKVYLAGIGMGNSDSRTLGCERAVREAQCLIGAKRMLDGFDTAGKNTFEAVAFGRIAEYIRESDFNTYTVLLSGDTGFYSGAKKLAEEMSDIDTEILPGIGSLVYFCSKLRVPWENVRALSLHGRDCNFVAEVRRNERVFALLGGSDGVQAALGRLINAGLGGVRVAVGSRLGYNNESITCGTASEIVNDCFDPLSVLMVFNEDAKDYVVTGGIEDDAFDRDEVPMTKSEVRAVVLSKLQLTENAVVYDVGSGSGSVTVECALKAIHGHVYGIEVKDTAVALTKRNAAKFGCENLTVVSGSAPEALEGLPAPTHVFIGGSRGKLRPIIDLVLAKNPDCRIVVTAVTLETVSELNEITTEFECSDIALVSVTKTRGVGRFRLFAAQNPVYVYSFKNRKLRQEA